MNDFADSLDIWLIRVLRESPIGWFQSLLLP